MRKSIIAMVLVFSGFVTLGQTFKGIAFANMETYNCTFRINKDSTINFIYAINENCVYAEHIGTITRVDDTLFHVAATITIAQFSMKTFDIDTLYILLDSAIALELDKIQIEYTNKTYRQLQGYDRHGNPFYLLKTPVDKARFNNKKGSDFVVITINRRNFITEELLSFKIPFGSSASFTKGQQEEFEVIIKDGHLSTTGTPLLQTGHFKLKSK